MLTISIILIIVGICMCMDENVDYKNRVREEERHRELMAKLDEEDLRESRKRVTRRRIAKDSAGNTLAEEIVEEDI